ncbi:hypothetical protein DUI87_13534 [Hirundo rustica rustica]|uniref:Gag-Pol polyprotein n=1 Tax=Hirundo rustica rustica TaxID=333673 RepID=A0A3M0KRK5_HIRRU|nr:hypothetical protein DUI87_13534 [Hirundo rustica rustica]
MDFLVDSGAEKSTFKQLPPGCKISKDSMMVIGAKGEPFKVPIVKDVEIETENKICLGDMLLVEEADYNLLGRDLMVALGINLIVKDSKLIVSLYKLTLKDEREINPKVWHTGREAGRLEMEPISIEIKRPEDPIRVKQYPISLEGREGTKILQYVDDLLIAGQEEGDVKACTISLLNFLGKKGLKVSKSKLQFAEPEQKADKWLTDARLLKYEAILIHAPELELRTTKAKNPAEFLFGEASEGPTHNCSEMTELQTKIRADLEEEELEEGEKWFVDGSAQVLEGKRRSGYAVIDGKTGKVVESGPLSASWSAQACELYAVLQALKGLKGKAGTIYTDSKYAFGVVHTFGKIWEEKGLINTRGKSLVHENLIKQILEAIREPKAITVVYVKGHQMGMQFRTRGNNLADQEAKRAALLTLNAPETLEGEPQEFPPCPSEKEKEEFKKIGGILEEGKWKLPDGRELIPKDYARKILKRLHLQTHWGTQALAEQFLKFFGCKGIYELAKQEVQGCMTCQRINRSRTQQVSPGGRPLAYCPFGRIQVDFTESPKIGRHRYLLVIVDQLTHWVEAFPSPQATTQVVAKKLLEEIIPRYGIADSIDSDQGTHFTSKIIKHLANALGIQWEYHTPWHPQSLGQVERMNQTLKAQLSKIVLETKMSWVKCLPLALLNIRTQPHSGSGLSPFEMLYGMPYEHGMPVGHPQVEDCQIQSYLGSINKNLQELRKSGQILQSTPLGFAIHKIQSGDKVLIKTWKEAPLTPHWEGPFLVLLTMDTAVRTAEKGWTHSSRVKKVKPRDNTPEWRITSSLGDLKLKIHRQTQ